MISFCCRLPIMKNSSFKEEALRLGKSAKSAARALAPLSAAEKNRALLALVTHCSTASRSIPLVSPQWRRDCGRWLPYRIRFTK
jgi:hypothetical protein